MHDKAACEAELLAKVIYRLIWSQIPITRTPLCRRVFVSMHESMVVAFKLASSSVVRANNGVIERIGLSLKFTFNKLENCSMPRNDLIDRWAQLIWRNWLNLLIFKSKICSAKQSAKCLSSTWKLASNSGAFIWLPLKVTG